MDNNTQLSYEADKENIENFLSHKSETFDYYALKRLITTELAYNKAFSKTKICGLTRTQIVNMIEYPERYGSYIIRLSQYMVLKSGYYRRLIDYHANMAVLNWTIDLEVKNAGMYKVKPDTLRSNYYKVAAHMNKYRLDQSVTDIFRRLYTDDAVFGFISETDVDAPIFWLDPRYCVITKLVNGNVFEYAIDRSLLSASYYESLPHDLQQLLEQSAIVSKNNLVEVPYDKSFCIKYNSEFTYLYPVFFGLIADILLIEDMTALTKAKTEGDTYKLLYYKLPTKDGKMTMDDNLVTPFAQMGANSIPESWGFAVAPFDAEIIQGNQSSQDTTDKVERAIEHFYDDAGISKAILSSASSGSELKLSMKVDSSDIYKCYRKIEAWANLQLKLKGFIYPSYDLSINILKQTIFDIESDSGKYMKLTQASLSYRSYLYATNGVNTAKMLGSEYLEDVLLKEQFDRLQPLKTSYTQSGSSSDITDEGGRPTIDETELSDVSITQKDNGSGDVDNR